MKPAVETYTSRLDEAAARDLAATMRNAESLQARDADPRPLPDAPSPMAFDMALLPESLRDDNPLGIWRRHDGVLGKL